MELLVVIVIIGIVSAVALPTVMSALDNRQMSEAARILQGALVGARDRAIHQGQPSGIRLLPDPSFFTVEPATLPDGVTPNPLAGTTTTKGTLAYNRIIPIDPAPQYYEGYCTPVPTAAYINWTLPGPYQITPAYGVTWNQVPGSSLPPYLMVVESPANPANGTVNPPTSWFWNIRVGDKIQLNNSGSWYTVVGPMYVTPNQGNPDMFVNAGFPQPTSKLPVPTVTVGSTTLPAEFLFLVNGLDDNGNGWIDEGADGVDNDNDGLVDEPSCQQSRAGEWEAEAWPANVLSTTTNVPYTIQRRPYVAPGAREIALPTSVVIDATTLLNTRERSRLPVGVQAKLSGVIDIMLNPDGTVLPTTEYSTPSSFGMDQAFYHFWLAERRDVQAVRLDSSGNPAPIFAGGAGTPQNDPYFLPIAQPGGNGAASFPGPYLQGQYAVVTLNGRTGQVTTSMMPPFLLDSTAGWTNQPTGTAVHSVAAPFAQAQQGLQTGP